MYLHVCTFDITVHTTTNKNKTEPLKFVMYERLLLVMILYADYAASSHIFHIDIFLVFSFLFQQAMK